MPNRIIRESFLESDPINSLGWAEECFFIRLMLKADDFGRFHADVRILKSYLYPLKLEVREADITRWLAACEKSGVIRVFESGGKRYLEIPKFGQRTRSEVSRFPDPCPSNDGQLSDIGQSSAHVVDSRPVEDDSRKSKTEVDWSAIIPFKSEAFKEVWKLWVDYRKASRKPLTPQTIQLQFAEIKEFGEERAIKAIKNSIKKSYQGIFEETYSQHQKPKAPEIRVKTQAEYEAEDEEIRRQSREKFKLEIANGTC